MSRTSRTSTPRTSKVKAHDESSNIPFPEWQDSEVINEKWDVIKDAKRPSIKRKSISSKKSTDSLSCTDINYFIDTQNIIIPPSIEVDCWKRLNEIFEDVEFVISKQTIDFAALAQSSKHILHSEFMRVFLSNIGILEYISTIRRWNIESVTNTFTPNTENIAWKPWHHIYSHCGAGKGTPHMPKYNPSGKYIVRLHWLGCWRKIYVDDRVPVDKDQNILLPGCVIKKKEEEEFNDSGSDKKSLSSRKSKRSKISKLSFPASENKKGKKPVEPKKELSQVEIWPYILAKALLKIACLTWTNGKEVVDFSPITCLTGWICQKIDTTEMNSNDKWNICTAYSPKFQWEQDEDAQSRVAESEKSDKTENEIDGKDSKKNKKKAKKQKPEQTIDETKVYCLVGSCDSIANFVKDIEIENMPNDWNQHFLIEQSRDIALIKPQPRPELPRWKRFRWIYWAISKGLWPDDEFAPPIRCVKFYNTLKKDEISPLETETSMEVSPTKTNKKAQSSKMKIKDSKKSAKGKNKGKGKGGELKIFPVINKSIWLDYAEIEAHIDTLSIFFRPSQFTSFVKLSNLIKHSSRSETYIDNKDKAKKGGDTKICQELKWTLNIKESRNEALYLLIDSLDRKLLVLNLCQVGHVDRIMVPSKPIDEKPYANIVLEDYSWQENKIGRVQVFLSTTGTKSVPVYLNPGRIIYKLWIWCTGDYVLTLLSNSQITIGNIDNIVEAMSTESLLLGKFAQEVGMAFGNLVHAFGTPSYMDEMKKFTAIYKSNMPLNKLKSKEIYKEFMNLLLKNIKSKEESFALKVLFLDPDICYQTMRKEIVSHCPSITWDADEKILDDEDILEIKAQENAAIKIQSIFKTIYIKKLLERHTQGSRKHNEIYDGLKEVYYDIFSDAKRTICMNILKDLYFSNEIFKMSYLYKDLVKAFDIKSYKGSTTTIYNTWVFITRQKFINRSSEPLVMKTILFSNLSKYVVRIFNNDTDEEINRFTNHAETCFYPPNRKGFTVLCYGWTTETMRITWKLCLLFLKINTPSFITAEENLDVKTLSYCYNPNIYNNICKCKVEVRQTAEVTVRLSTSSVLAEIELAIHNCYNKTIAKIQGKHNVILPLIKLKCANSEDESDFRVSGTRKLSKFKSPPKNKPLPSKDKMDGATSFHPSVYYVEAKVLSGTWPLTKKEWLTVRTQRKKYLLHPPISDSASQKMSKKKVTAMEIMERPFWSLQIIHNVGDNITVGRDLTRQNEINEIKKSWYEEDPDRYGKSKTIREEYLQKVSSEVHDSCSSVLLQQSIESDMTLTKWIPETLMLSTFDLAKHYSPDQEERRCLNMNEWESTLLNRSENNVHQLYYTLSQCKERMEKLSCDQIEEFVIIRQWYEECRKDSEELMTISYNLRDQFINMLIESNKKPTDVTKEKNTKDKGKAKKGKKEK